MTNYIANPIKQHGYAPTENFTLILNDTVRDDRITADAFRVLSLLLSHRGGYQESQREIANRYGWGRDRTSNAFQQLCAERLLIVQKHLTTKGTRAYEMYHVHCSRRFTEAEVAEFGETVVLVPERDRGWTQNGTGGGPDSGPGVDLKWDHTEEQLEDQLEEKREEKGVRLLKDPATHAQAKENQASRERHFVEESPSRDRQDEEMESLAEVIFLPNPPTWEEQRRDQERRLLEYMRTGEIPPATRSAT